MNRRSVITGLTALSGAGGIVALLPGDGGSDESPTDTPTAREQPVRIRVSNTLSSDVQASIAVRSADEAFLTANITSTPGEEQALGLPVPTDRDYELSVDVDAELDSPDDVSLGRHTVRASGSSLSTEDSYGFTLPETTALRVTIGGRSFLDIEPVEH